MPEWLGTAVNLDFAFFCENTVKLQSKDHKNGKIENSLTKTPRVFPSLIMLNYALWGASHASGASFLHNFAIFFAKLRQNYAKL